MANPKGLALTHFAVLLFGLSGPLSVFIGLPALELSMARSLIAGLLLLAFVRPSWEGFKMGMRSQWIAGLLLAFHWFGFFYATLEGSIAWGLLSFAGYPLWTVILKCAMEKQWPAMKAWFSVLLILCGTFLLVYKGLDVLGPASIILGVSSSAAFALLQCLNSRSMKGSEPTNIAAFQMLLAAIFLSPFVSWTAFDLAIYSYGFLMIHAVIVTAFAYALFLKGLNEIGGAKASFIAALEPVYGLIIAFILLGQSPPLLHYFAAILILMPSFIRIDPGLIDHQ